MPRVDIWIRVDDLEKWNAIEDKPAWLHNALNGSLSFHKGDKISMQVIAKPIDKKASVEVGISKERLANGLCKKHGTPLDARGQCLQKGH